MLFNFCFSVDLMQRLLFVVYQKSIFFMYIYAGNTLKSFKPIFHIAIQLPFLFHDQQISSVVTSLIPVLKVGVVVCRPNRRRHSITIIEPMLACYIKIQNIVYSFEYRFMFFLLILIYSPIAIFGTN